MIMKTPIQQLKDNYYLMSESEFHYWVSRNMETLLKAERDMIVKAYNRDVIDGIQNWFISDGEKYYNLHYRGENKGIEYKSEPDQNYTFEDGV
jgi:hypothetical protein